MYYLLLIYIFEGIVCYSLGLPNANDYTCEITSLLILSFNICISVCLIVKLNNKDKNIIILLIISLFIKTLLLLWDYYCFDIFILPNSHADTEGYHWWAVAYTQGITTLKHNYSYIIGFIYHYFGIQRITAQFLNIILSLISIELLYKMLLKLKLEYRVIRRTVLLAALLPNFLIMSCILLRECIMACIICVSLYLFVIWWIYNNPISMLFAYVISFFAIWFHSGCMALPIGYTIILMITKRYMGERILNISFKTIIVGVVFLFVFAILSNKFSDTLFLKFGGEISMESIDKQVDNVNSDRIVGNSTYRVGTNQKGISGLIVNSPIRMFYFLSAPLPWMIRSIGDIIAFLFSSLFYGGSVIWTFNLLIKRKKLKNKPLIIAVLVLCLCSAFIFAWGVQNVGTALRHREKFYFLYLLLYALIYNEALLYKK